MGRGRSGSWSAVNLALSPPPHPRPTSPQMRDGEVGNKCAAPWGGVGQGSPCVPPYLCFPPSLRPGRDGQRRPPPPSPPRGGRGVSERASLSRAGRRRARLRTRLRASLSNSPSRSRWTASRRSSSSSRRSTTGERLAGSLGAGGRFAPSPAGRGGLH